MKLTNITKTYHNKQDEVIALKNINLEVNERGITVLLGPSGSGKSTLLNILAGQDKEYEGTLEINEKLDYITQDFRLFESMSVEENLQIVSSNQEQINYYLDLFKMSEHKDKKVKKCSNGQKKRVQFIRAMLQAPSILLCDEPTAALDHENSELLMEQLKQISENVTVFLVTHDIALAEKYADRILVMDSGEIISDKKINTLGKVNVVSKKYIQSTKQTVYTVLKKLKSRPIETILMLVMALFISSSLYVSTNMFNNVDSQTYNSYVWKNNLNLIVSRAKEENLIDHNYELDGPDPLYKKEAVVIDVYHDSDVSKVVEKIDDVIAVEAFYDFNRYWALNKQGLRKKMDPYFQTVDTYGWQGYVTLHKQPSFFPMFITEAMLTQKGEEHTQKIIEHDNQNRERRLKAFKEGEHFGYQVFRMEEVESEAKYKLDPSINSNAGKKAIEYCYPFLDELPAEELAYWGRYQVSHFYENDRTAKVKESFHPYELVNNYVLPMQYGSMPTNLNEVVLELHTAEFIKAKYNFNSLEEMIGKEIEVGVPIWVLSWDTFDFKIMPFEFSSLKIAGITSLESKSQKQIFFMPGGVKATLLKNVVKENEDIPFTEFNVLVNPQANVAKVRDELSTLIEPVNNEFMLYVETISDLVKEQDVKGYMNARTFGLYGLACMIVILLVLLLYYVLNRKRFKKEALILHLYGYSTIKEISLRFVFIYFGVFLVMLALLPNIISKMNVFVKQYHYDSLVNFNLMPVLLCLLFTYVIHLAMEMLLSK